ncbi:unannotated protein [freshwater metagenome]|uniref:Unannotated protein n=1 Tax=freshwater metagenome TaxID=449393 RepID=A0A6J7VQ47_9ZZZZ
MNMPGRHLVHPIEVGHDHVHDLQTGFGASQARIFGSVRERGLIKRRNRLVTFPVGERTQRGITRNQIVKVRRAGAGESGDDHRRSDFDVVDFRMTGQQVGEQKTVL